jgi:phosphate transport system substrate-binding protein
MSRYTRVEFTGASMAIPILSVFRLPWCVCVVLTFILSSAISQSAVAAQTAESLAGVKRIAVDWNGADKASGPTRDRVVQKLKASRAIALVAAAQQPDAVLHGNVTVWVIGHESPTPHSKSIERAIYRGYASVEVTGKDGRTLWSYLVTPRSSGWKRITDDLADQLAQALLAALTKKDAGEALAAAGSTSGVGASQPIALRGGGSTFSQPIYQKWFETFASGRPNVTIQYEGVGSEEGIRRLVAGQFDFGASDRPLGEQELKAQGYGLLQIATVLGAVVPIYNVQGLRENLNVTGDLLAGIFLGKIQRWNAPEIRAINKHAYLPDEQIVAVHRSDGSGTTFALTDFLAKVNPQWKSAVGAGTSVEWPVGIGAEHNDGVAEAVRKTPNSIRYVEFIYALQREL